MSAEHDRRTLMDERAVESRDSATKTNCFPIQSFVNLFRAASKIRLCGLVLVLILLFIVYFGRPDNELKPDDHHRPTKEVDHRRPTKDVDHHRPTKDVDHHRPTKDADHHRPTKGVDDHQSPTEDDDDTGVSFLPPPRSSAEAALLAIYRLLVSHGARLVLTQTEDLLDESSFLRSSFLNPEVVVTRVGVLEEDFPAVRSALDGVMELKLWGVSRKNVRVPDPRAWTPDKKSEADGKITTHVFIKVALNDSSLPAIKPKFAKQDQFFHWKRLHFQVIFNRGVKSVDQPRGYRWIGAESDDIGEPRLPAESYEAFDVQPLTSGDAVERRKTIVFVPKDKKLFVSEKKSAEFKECPTHEQSIRKKFENNWRGKVVTDAEAIRKYMTSIMAVKRLVRPYGIRSWLNCGTLLGWYRQCSLIPKDPDIDMLHYSSPEFYPRIHADILAQKNLFKIIKVAVNEDSPGGYQRGFYWKLGIKSGINVDTYFYFSHKLYDMNHKKGDIKYFDFTDKICSADLHGYRVYVLCTYEKNRDLSRVYYGPDIFKPK